jgi:hypothetical protein
VYPFEHLPLEAITAKNPQNMSTAVSLKVSTNLLINISASGPSNEKLNLEYSLRTGGAQSTTRIERLTVNDFASLY